MGANEVLRYIEVGGAALAGIFGMVLAIVAFRHREKIARGEKLRAEKRAAQARMSEEYWENVRADIREPEQRSVREAVQHR